MDGMSGVGNTQLAIGAAVTHLFPTATKVEAFVEVYEVNVYRHINNPTLRI